MSPTCAGTLRGVQIVVNVGVSKAWTGRVVAALATPAGSSATASAAAANSTADHAVTSIWPIIDMSPCSAAWQWKT